MGQGERVCFMLACHMSDICLRFFKQHQLYGKLCYYEVRLCKNKTKMEAVAFKQHFQFRNLEQQLLIGLTFSRMESSVQKCENLIKWNVCIRLLKDVCFNDNHFQGKHSCSRTRFYWAHTNVIKPNSVPLVLQCRKT